MAGGSGSRPGVGLIAFGAVVVGMSAARIASGWAPGPGWLLYESAFWAVGAALGLWGWSRLRRAKATDPDLSWREFLHTDLIGIGVFVALFAVLAAMPAELRDRLMQFLREVHDAIGIARGRP